MGRPKAFNQEETLDIVMKLFWRNGFSALGFETISQKTGLSRSSLYAEFKDKEELYARAIDRYLSVALLNYEQHLSVSPPSVKNIDRYFSSLDMSQHYDGCFMVKSIAEVAKDKPEIRKKTQAFLNKIESLFDVNLREVLPLASKRKPIAAMLLSFDLGYSILGLAWPSKDEHEKALKGIRTILGLIEDNHNPRIF